MISRILESVTVKLCFFRDETVASLFFRYNSCYLKVMIVFSLGVELRNVVIQGVNCEDNCSLVFRLYRNRL